MASPILHLLVCLVLLLFKSPPSTAALTCSSQTFSSHFTNCTDLPTLKSFLHWTYDPTNSTLSVAFIASPASPDGWIAWGINPTTPSMVGTQSLIAFKSPKGDVVVKTYNLTSYKSITEATLSYKLLESKAESSDGGVMKIFATLQLPEKTTRVNHIWQVGGAVVDGTPAAHKFDPANLNSKATLDLTTASVPQSGNETAGGSSTIIKTQTIVFSFLFFIGLVVLN